MPDRVPLFTADQIGYKAVRFSSKGVFETHKDKMVDPYAATRIPKEHQVQGFHYWPQAEGKFPAIVLLHDKWGLTPDTNDLAAQLACEGYAVLTPNLYGRQGGMVTANEEVADALAERIDFQTVMQDINASCEFLNANLPEDPAMESTVRNAHAVVGLGLGGTLAILFAFKRKRLHAAVSFYGDVPATTGGDKDTRMHCRLLYHAAETEKDGTATAAGSTAAGLEQLASVAKESGKDVDVRKYPGVSYGFCDKIRTNVYNEPAATQAWDATVTFLKTLMPSVQPATPPQ